MAEFTAYEQLLLELINRARLDPASEAARLGITLNAGLPAGTITATPKQALAGNEALVAAARGHSQYMITTDQFNHQGIGDGTPTSRMETAGYTFAESWANGENIAWIGTTGTVNELAFVTQIADNLFRSAHHRENILDGYFREAGTGIADGTFVSGGTSFNSVMATQNFATSGAAFYVTGVAINDGNLNNFYDIGEGRSGISIAVTTGGLADGSALSAATGGYNAAVSAGTHVVTFSGGDLATDVSVTVATGAANAKIDLSGQSKILTSVTATLGAGASDLALLGASAINGTGNTGNNVIDGNRAANILSGDAGNDTLSGKAGNDVLIGGAGVDILTGGGGADRFDFNDISEIGMVAGARDVIKDFTHNATLALSDRIDLATIDANGAGAGSTAFSWLGTAAFTGKAGQLHYGWLNPAGTADDRTIVSGDVNGDKIADFRIELVGLKSLVAADFIL